MTVDLKSARSFLETRFGGGISDVQAIGRGVWSRCFAFRRGDCAYVVRFGAYREDFEKDCIAAGYASPDLPVPRVTDMGEALGAHCAISERVYGEYIDDIDEAEMRALLPSVLIMLNALRLADITGTSGYGMWNGRCAAPHPTWRAALLDVAADRPADRIHGWRERLEQSDLGIAPFEEAYGRLRAPADNACGERCLIHNDLLQFNVLVQGGRVTGLLDWGCSMYGDSLYDLAWFCSWQPWYPAWIRQASKSACAYARSTSGWVGRLTMHI